MKKLLSLILSICMLSAFAFSVSAATLPTGIKLAVTETETGAVAEISALGSYVGLSSIQAIVGFNTAKLTYDSTVYETFNKWDTKSTTLNKTKDAYVVKIAALTDTDADFLTGENTKVMTVKFNKIDSATSAKGDITLLQSTKVGKNTMYSEAYCGEEKTSKDTIVLDADSFTAYTPDEPDKPSFVIDDSAKSGVNNGNIVIDTNTETGAYSVKVTAPIGKTPIIVIDGKEIPGAEYSGTATKETKIAVKYEDITADVVTYVVPMSSIYGEKDGIVAFGKGTIAEGDDFGIIFGGIKEEKVKLSAKERTTEGAVTDIFGVEVQEATAGKYTAQAYIGANVGEEISFTK